MSDLSLPTGPSPSPRGLATLALLKTYYDQSRDHLDMFAPFVLDTARHADGLSAADIRKRLSEMHGLFVPMSTLDLILGRLVKAKSIDRQGGRYFGKQDPQEAADLLLARRGAEARQLVLARELREYSSNTGVPFPTDQDALEAILSFFHHYHLDVLLEDPAEYVDSTRALPRGPLRTVARFVDHLRESEDPLSDTLQELLEGFILQNTLLLTDIDLAKKDLSRLKVFFDTGFLFAVIGLKGALSETAAKETLELLKATGASLGVFQRTIGEMRRILAVYEEHLATPDGITSLYPTDLTRYIVSHRLRPSDIHQISVLLESSLRRLGLEAEDYPPHHHDFTLDETRLAQLLKRPGSQGRDIEPRVHHDVDCIAAALTLRAGCDARRIEDAVAVFATTTGLVVKHVRQWFAEMREEGVSPAIHVLALSNLAWLKNPRASSSLKLNELTAMCAAALRPSRRLWGQFLRHLQQLRESDQISSDEAIAVVASSMTDRLLSHVEDDAPVDADTISDVVARVRDSYAQEAENKVLETKELASAAIGLMRMDLDQERDRRIAAENAERDSRSRLEGRLGHVAGVIAWIAFAALLSTCAVAMILAIPGVLPSGGPVLTFAKVSVAIAGLISFGGLLLRGHPQDLRLWLKARLTKSLLRWVGGAA